MSGAGIGEFGGEGGAGDACWRVGVVGGAEWEVSVLIFL